MIYEDGASGNIAATVEIARGQVASSGILEVRGGADVIHSNTIEIASLGNATGTNVQLIVSGLGSTETQTGDNGIGIGNTSSSGLLEVSGNGTFSSGTGMGVLYGSRLILAHPLGD